MTKSGTDGCTPPVDGGSVRVGIESGPDTALSNCGERRELGADVGEPSFGDFGPRFRRSRSRLRNADGADSILFEAWSIVNRSSSAGDLQER